VVRVPGKRLSFEERQFISAARGEGLSLRAIGRELGRPHTTISREIHRNLMTLGRNRVYRSTVAEHRTRVRAKRPKVFKLQRNRRLARVVERLLARRWSPRQIERKLRKDHPDDPRWWVSSEAIYRSIYVQGRGGLRAELHTYLKSRRKARKSTDHGYHGLSDKVHFSLRPAEANDRAIPGHWEGDLLIGKNSGSQVGMLTERTTRFTLLFALPTDRSAPTVRDALGQIVARIPHHLRRSLTWDNGTEMGEHVAFTDATSMQVYFADPASPWQRGTAEQTIGLIRAYLPKSTDLSHYTQQDLDHISEMLNERLRESLDWRSPEEAYAELLSGAMTA
jgi:IS30 family transposase